ncbi:hypothetical protein LDENG_00252670 [Lucifuga dentata]|nr:hypothetical protein LDENG_00252670 [Lucifuga dentata]
MLTFSVPPQPTGPTPVSSWPAGSFPAAWRRVQIQGRFVPPGPEQLRKGEQLDSIWDCNKRRDETLDSAGTRDSSRPPHPSSAATTSVTMEAELGGRLQATLQRQSRRLSIDSGPFP